MTILLADYPVYAEELLVSSLTKALSASLLILGGLPAQGSALVVPNITNFLMILGTFNVCVCLQIYTYL